MTQLLLDQLSDDLEVWPLYFHFAGLFYCLLTSTIFHSFGCKRPCVYKYLRRLDMSGIFVTLMSGIYPFAHYNFYCHTWIRNIYLLIQISCFIFFFTIIMQDWFYDSKHIQARVLVFVGFGVISSIPSAHAILVSYDFINGQVFSSQHKRLHSLPRNLWKYVSVDTNYSCGSPVL